MVTSGAGIFDDGTTRGAGEVAVALEPLALAVRAIPDAAMLARWPYGEIARSPAAGGLSLTLRGRRQRARLEIVDPALAAAVAERLGAVESVAAAERRSRLKFAGIAGAAVVWLVLVAVFGVPALAGWIAPILPAGVERALGDKLDRELRAQLDTRHLGDRFECAKGDASNPGRRALDKLVGQLAAAAELPVDLRTRVLRRAEANAFALPGGHIYLFEGLIGKANTPDELAGVIAHEIGHVAHRDGTRSILQAAGLGLMLGLLLHEVGFSGAIVQGGQALLRQAYSRDVEAQADRYGVALIGKIGGDAHAFATMLERISGAIEPASALLLDHPLTATRVAAINAAAVPASGRALLDPAEWAALKKICGGR